ncbi:MAG TPA: hypothetical protein VFW86_05095, partial [Candidatus Limnocylindrales bacterium]|nr:hypothetical protein [Candidatus Limnocylindrales bacterium]
ALPAVTLGPDEIADAARGRFVRPAAGITEAEEGAIVRLLDPSGALVGIGRRAGRRVAPEKMSIAVNEPDPNRAPDRAAERTRDRRDPGARPRSSRASPR